MSINDSFESRNKSFLAKVYQQAQMQVKQPQVSQSLNCEDRVVFLRGLTLYHNFPLHKDVYPKRITHINSLVSYRDTNFFLHLKPSRFKFKRQSVMIHRFQQPRSTKCAVHRYCGIKDNLTYLVLFHLIPLSPLCLCASVLKNLSYSTFPSAMASCIFSNSSCSRIILFSSSILRRSNASPTNTIAQVMPPV